MSVKEEIKKYWKEFPFWGKVIWVITAFLASSSIASLSDAVFAWKGFILDGIEFYRTLINPIKEFIGSIFEVRITNPQADLIVFLGIFISAYRKFVTHRWLVSNPSIKITLLLVSINILLWLVTMVFVVVSILGKLHIILDIFVILYLLYMLQYPVTIFALDKIPEDSPFHKTLGVLMLKAYSKNKARFFIIYYSPVITAIALLFILAAINSGLTR